MNKSDNKLDDILYMVTENWRRFGMSEPFNSCPRYFNPNENAKPPIFHGERMLVSTDELTFPDEAHTSVARDLYCKDGRAGKDDGGCETKGPTKIGYEPYWRCIFGTGDSGASKKPAANAGPDQKISAAVTAELISCWMVPARPIPIAMC